jgi:serine protease Do
VSSTSEDGFRFFWNDPETTRVPSQVRIGGGLIITSDGFIITKHSIIENATQVFVTFVGNHKLQAEVVGSDSVSMIAVLRVNETTVTAARLGRAESSMAGAWAITIGNSMGMPHAVSVGTVNGMRDDGMLQISSNVDPGYSGAPVFNSAGEAIGLVAAVVNYEREDGSPMAEYYGHSTLVWPMSFLLPQAQRLIDEYYARHGWLGVTVNRAIRENKLGLKVVRLDESGPGKKAGMRVDDVITDFDGQQLTNMSDLRKLVLERKPGEKVEIGLLRQDAPLRIQAEVGRRRGDDYFKDVAPAPGNPSVMPTPRPRQ